MAEFMEPTVHEDNDSNITLVQDIDLSSSLCEDISVGPRIITDKRFVKDLIKQARKDWLELIGPDGDC